MYLSFPWYCWQLLPPKALGESHELAGLAVGALTALRCLRLPWSRCCRSPRPLSLRAAAAAVVLQVEASSANAAIGGDNEEGAHTSMSALWLA